MLRNEKEILSHLDKVRITIANKTDSCDYETLISEVSEDVRQIELLLELYQGEGVSLRLNKLKEDAEKYLKILNWYKVKNVRAAQESESEK